MLVEMKSTQDKMVEKFKKERIDFSMYIKNETSTVDNQLIILTVSENLREVVYDPS